MRSIEHSELVYHNLKRSFWSPLLAYANLRELDSPEQAVETALTEAIAESGFSSAKSQGEKYRIVCSKAVKLFRRESSSDRLSNLNDSQEFFLLLKALCKLPSDRAAQIMRISQEQLSSLEQSTTQAFQSVLDGGFASDSEGDRLEESTVSKVLISDLENELPPTAPFGVIGSDSEFEVQPDENKNTKLVVLGVASLLLVAGLIWVAQSFIFDAGPSSDREAFNFKSSLSDFKDNQIDNESNMDSNQADDSPEKSDLDTDTDPSDKASTDSTLEEFRTAQTGSSTTFKKDDSELSNTVPGPRSPQTTEPTRAKSVSIVNNTFENIESTKPEWYTMVPDNRVRDWKASNGFIEVANSGFMGAEAPQGEYFIELNSSRFNQMTQEFETTPGTTIEWSFYHKGRVRTDSFVFGLGSSQRVNDWQMITTGNDDWQYYSGVYEVPSGQYRTTLYLTSSGRSPNGSEGNFIDHIQIKLVG